MIKTHFSFSKKIVFTLLENRGGGSTYKDISFFSITRMLGLFEKVEGYFSHLNMT